MYRFNQREETIVALATPPGEGGIAIVRLSGKRAFSIADNFFSKKVSNLPTHTIHFGTIRDNEGHSIDKVLLLIMRAPKTFTGDDTVEIHCHGGMLASRKIIERALQEGAHHALAGEFSLRAFLNNKIDLVQAEAVAGLIHAKNERVFQYEKELLEGALSRKIQGFNQKLIDLAAIVEAWVDFPDEGLDLKNLIEIKKELFTLSCEIEKLMATFHDGKKMKVGVSLCISGPPNSGKSSLLNALLGESRAIVTSIPGTTRDILEEELLLNGCSYRLIDTAGIRHTLDLIESEGIERAKKAISRADLVLFVLDASKGFEREEHDLLNSLPQVPSLVVWNKMDLVHGNGTTIQAIPHELSHLPSVHISAKEKTGFDELKEKIEELSWKKGVSSKEEMVLTHERHYEALFRAHKALQSTLQGLENGLSFELIAFELKFALKELAAILGHEVSEEILSSIFSKFCIGK